MKKKLVGVHTSHRWLNRVPVDKVSATMKKFRKQLGIKVRAVYRDRSGQKRYHMDSSGSDGYSLKKHATHADIYIRV